MSQKIDGRTKWHSWSSKRVKKKRARERLSVLVCEERAERMMCTRTDVQKKKMEITDESAADRQDSLGSSVFAFLSHARAYIHQPLLLFFSYLTDLGWYFFSLLSFSFFYCCTSFAYYCVRHVCNSAGGEEGPRSLMAAARAHTSSMSRTLSTPPPPSPATTSKC